MAYFYVDAATGSDSLSNGGSWATACATLIYLLDTATTNPAAGDVVFIRANASETTKDTAAATRTITSPGTYTQPLRVIGVKAGTTNTGASVVASDLAVLSGDQPVIECTGAGNDLNITGGSVIFSYINFTAADAFQYGSANHQTLYFNCDINCGDMNASANGSYSEIIGCEIAVSDTTAWAQGNRHRTIVRGGDLTGSVTNLFSTTTETSYIELNAVNLNGLTVTNLHSGSSLEGIIKFINCHMPSSYTETGTTLTNSVGYLELVGCNSTTTKANTGSYQDYHYEDVFGIVEDEPTIVRTGGADDGADGSFSYKLTPNASSVLDGSGANLASPWMRVWVAGGSAITATVYTVHDDAGTLGRDLYEQELWCEFYTPDASDTAQHDQTFDPAQGFITDGTTAAGTVDTTSTWVTHNTYKRSFAATVTPGYEGFVYARIHVAHNAATPVSVYVDPKIEIT